MKGFDGTIPHVRMLLPVALIAAAGMVAPAFGQGQQAAIPGAVDTVLAQGADQVASALASAFAEQQMVQPGTEDELAAAVRNVLSRSASAGVRSVSTPLDSTGLANWVLPVARRYIRAVGGRYVMDAIISEVDAAQTRLRIVPLFIAEVPESDGPLGGRPLPSAGVIERQVLGAVTAQLGR